MWLSFVYKYGPEQHRTHPQQPSKTKKKLFQNKGPEIRHRWRSSEKEKKTQQEYMQTGRQVISTVSNDSPGQTIFGSLQILEAFSWRLEETDHCTSPFSPSSWKGQELEQ